MAETVVLVNGIPGSGKSTLAAPLARKLELPLLGRDVVKESLFDSLGTRDRQWSGELGRAAAGVIWALVPFVPGPAAVDNNVGPATRDLFLADAKRAGVSRIIEVWCEISPELAYERYQARARTTRHPGHDDLQNGWAMSDMQAQNVPLGVGPLLRVATEHAVDADAVAEWVRRQL